MMFIKDGGTFQELSMIDLHNNCRGQGIGLGGKETDTLILVQTHKHKTFPPTGRGALRGLN